MPQIYTAFATTCNTQDALGTAIHYVVAIHYVIAIKSPQMNFKVQDSGVSNAVATGVAFQGRTSKSSGI